MCGLLSAMTLQPTIATSRLFLRPFRFDDAFDLQRLANDQAIADTTISIPHPYELQYAQQWIAKHKDEYDQKRAVHFAIVLQASQELIGATELRDIDLEHLQAELGFWIARSAKADISSRSHWGRGFASEAAETLLDYGFNQLGIHRIYAHHLVRNPASGRILEKLGLRQEGLMIDRTRKWGVFEDVVLRAVTQAEWMRR